MHCPGCGFENPEGLKFCNDCGTPLQMPCAQCGFANQPQAKFCGACGSALLPQAKVSSTPSVTPRQPTPLSYTPTHLAEKILTSKITLEGERKQVTVLFADLKGSMELLADRDPEDARQLLDPVLERMMAAVHRYEGTVNQVMGDGIMALFGAPIAHEDHAVRACYAALAMQDAIRHYSEEVRRTQGVAVQMRVGLNSGEVVVRAIDSSLHMDYTAVGQTTHLAARMEQLALPGSIRLTADTLRLVEGYVEVTRLGPVPVKGLAESIAVYELGGAGPVRSRLQAAAARGLTRLVGRHRELDHLTQALAWAGSGHGQVVALVGEPGVGKSRLVDECLHASRTQGWAVLESHAVSYGQATPYLPVIDLLKGYVGIDARDDSPRRREKIVGKVLGLDAALEPILPPLLALLDVPVDEADWPRLDPSVRRRRTLEAVKRLWLRESQLQPVLVVVEDLQWIDGETQAVLDSLVESLQTARLLLLLNYRPEYQHGWGRKTFYTQLRLDPLPPVSADEFLQVLLGDDSSLAPVKHLLIARTQGNPFFLEESVRTLVETGVLGGERGAYCPTQPIDTLQVPATVQAILAARIDRLSPEDKRLLQTAAVIGPEVPWPLLQAIAEVPEEALHRGLTRLQAAEFLYETRLFPEPEYTFAHALTHEVAYGSLLQRRRRALHARIVEALETLHADRPGERVEALAHHALKGELWAQALRYGRQAGEKALTRSAHREAGWFFEQALGVLPHLPETRDTREQAIDLRLAWRSALVASGHFGRILALLREAESLAEALDDPRRLSQVSRLLSNYFFLTGAYDQAIAAGQRALALATASGEVVQHALANNFLGAVYLAQGDYRRAIDCSGQAAAFFDGARRQALVGGYILPAVASRARLARGYAELGLFAEGTTHGEEGLRIAEAVAHPASLISAACGLGLLALRQGDLSRAEPLLERAVRLCRDADLPFYFPLAASALSAVYTLGGRVADAVLLCSQVTAQTTATATPVFEEVPRRLFLGEAQVLASHLDEARVLAEQALTLARAHQERGNQAYGLHLFGDMAARREPPEHAQADDYYRQALTLADELGMRPLQAHCHRGLGTLYSKIGDREHAPAELSLAIDLYRTMDMTFWLPQAEAALAQVEGR